MVRAVRMGIGSLYLIHSFSNPLPWLLRDTDMSTCPTLLEQIPCDTQFSCVWTTDVCAPSQYKKADMWYQNSVLAMMNGFRWKLGASMGASFAAVYIWYLSRRSRGLETAAFAAVIVLTSIYLFAVPPTFFYLPLRETLRQVLDPRLQYRDFWNVFSLPSFVSYTKRVFSSLSAFNLVTFYIGSGFQRIPLRGIIALVVTNAILISCAAFMRLYLTGPMREDTWQKSVLYQHSQPFRTYPISMGLIPGSTGWSIVYSAGNVLREFTRIMLRLSAIRELWQVSNTHAFPLRRSPKLLLTASSAFSLHSLLVHLTRSISAKGVPAIHLSSTCRPREKKSSPFGLNYCWVSLF